MITFNEFLNEKFTSKNLNQYVKKPIPVYALHYVDDNELRQWVGKDLIEQHGKFYIKTLEGNMEVKKGSYVVRGAENEHWAVKESVFEKTYERV